MIQPMQLQLFAEGPAPEGVQPAAPTEPPAPAPEGKTFTQEDVNRIAARESKAAVEKLLREAGIATEGDYKAKVKAFADWQQTQKTDLEKATEAKAALEADKTALAKEAETLRRQVAAINKGVPADKAVRYIKLAESYIDDKTDFAAALDLALKDFPVPVPAPTVPGAPGNPPASGGETKPKRPQGVITF